MKSYILLYIKFLLLFIFFVALMISVSFFYKKYKYQNIQFNTQSEIPKKEVSLFKDCADKKLEIKICLRDKSKEILLKNSSTSMLKDIYAELNTLESEKKLTSAECHYVSHQIGETTYFKNRDIIKLFQFDTGNLTDDINCSSGYYHGVLIGITKYNDSENFFANEIKRLENKYEPNNDGRVRNFNFWSSTLHGVGHALYIKDGNIEKSIDICKKVFSTDEKRSLCISGIYMEKSNEEVNVGLEPDPNFCLGQSGNLSEICFVGYRYSFQYLENLDNYVKVCDNLENPRNFYACIRYFHTQNISSHAYIKSKINNSIEFCKKLSTSEKRVDCMEIYTKTLKSFYSENNMPFVWSQIKEKVCSSLNPLEYLECRKKIDSRGDIEQKFTLPADSYFQPLFLNIFDLKYFIDDM